MKKNYWLILALLIGLSFPSCSQQNKETMIIIHTDLGDMKVKLYNETPLHRDNFIKLVKSGWYNGSIFHRVIENFMIQGGRGASGKEGPGYSIDAEFNPKLYHKKGALATARQNDYVNPEKKSNGSQFYIVHGKTFTDQEISYIEKKTGNTFTEEQKEIYRTIGGYPSLDMGYTVFGELVDGFEVLDKIAAVQTGAGDKPVYDVKMTMEIVQ